MKDFLTTAEVGERLGVTGGHVGRLIKMGRLPFVRNGSRLVIPKPAWNAFVAERSAEALAAVKEGEAHAEAAA